jgi:hypothetical protein
VLNDLLDFGGRYIQSTCATTGEGLYEGLDWLSSNIATKVRSPIISPTISKKMVTANVYLTVTSF